MNNKNAPITTENNGRNDKGQFTIGNAGRPKGTSNKTTKDVKNYIIKFLNDKAFELPSIWNSLEDKDRATLYLHLARLVMPKPTENDLQNNEEKEAARIVFKNYNLSPEDARKLAEELEKEY